MLFPTVEFALFFIVVFSIGWSLVGKPGMRKFFLTAASYFFYGYWDWRFAFLLLFCSYTSWLFGIMMRDSKSDRSRKNIITASVTINLSVLGFFKYYGFFTSSFNDMLHNLGVQGGIPFMEVVLPVGISFFTFQAMSYVIDVYRKDIPASSNLLDVLFYVSFFPQLVAGPIVRAADFMPQINLKPDIHNIQAQKAATLILGGLFKKIVIANYLASTIVDPVFNNPSAYSTTDVMFALYGYAVQIYCDFSAYSDIAIGIAHLFGFRFLENFNHPYRALSVQDFWRRWHISLSTWLRDYLYIPLGGNRKGKIMTYRNLALTMLLGGLWHGAAWNFILWGALHGGALAVERFFKEKFPSAKEQSVFGKIISTVLVFHFVCFTWIFFRSVGFDTASAFIASVLKFDFSVQLLTPAVALTVLFGIATNFTPKHWGSIVQEKLSGLHPVVQAVLVGVALMLISVMGPEGVAPFIYFQF